MEAVIGNLDAGIVIVIAFLGFLGVNLVVFLWSLIKRSVPSKPVQDSHFMQITRRFNQAVGK